jgi:hypothetical protein
MERPGGGTLRTCSNASLPGGATRLAILRSIGGSLKSRADRSKVGIARHCDGRPIAHKQAMRRRLQAFGVPAVMDLQMLSPPSASQCGGPRYKQRHDVANQSPDYSDPILVIFTKN